MFIGPCYDLPDLPHTDSLKTAFEPGSQQVFSHIRALALMHKFDHIVNIGSTNALLLVLLPAVRSHAIQRCWQLHTTIDGRTMNQEGLIMATDNTRPIAKFLGYFSKYQ